MCKCLLPPGVNTIAVDKYINININKFVISRSSFPGLKEERSRKDGCGANHLLWCWMMNEYSA
jgi:hypothetical protein